MAGEPGGGAGAAPGAGRAVPEGQRDAACPCSLLRTRSPRPGAWPALGTPRHTQGREGDGLGGELGQRPHNGGVGVGVPHRRGAAGARSAQHSPAGSERSIAASQAPSRFPSLMPPPIPSLCPGRWRCPCGRDRPLTEAAALGPLGSSLWVPWDHPSKLQPSASSRCFGSRCPWFGAWSRRCHGGTHVLCSCSAFNQRWSSVRAAWC